MLHGSRGPRQGWPHLFRIPRSQTQGLTAGPRRALLEAWAAQMWTQRTGVLLWKSQNPWTGLRGQLYDCLLGPTGGFYGAAVALRPLHALLDPLMLQVRPALLLCLGLCVGLGSLLCVGLRVRLKRPRVSVLACRGCSQHGAAENGRLLPVLLLPLTLQRKLALLPHHTCTDLSVCGTCRC